MTELRRETQAFLAAAKAQEVTCAEDRARIRAKLSRRMAAGLVIGTAVTAGSTAAKAAPASAWMSATAWVPGLAKVVGVAVIAGASGAVAVHWVETATEGPQSPDQRALDVGTSDKAPRASGVAMALPVAAQPTVAPGPSQEAAAPLASAEHSSSLSRRPQPDAPGPADSSRQPTAPIAPAAPVDSLASQVAAIRLARQAIRNGNGQAALGILNEQFPQGKEGALLPEATLARIAAHCELGNVGQARRLADDFVTRYPGSPLVSQVRGSCAYARNH